MSGEVTVREGTLDDSREIWQWWNDPLTRQMMRKNDPVPWEEHEPWFAGVLNDPNRILCVGLCDGEKLGVVRFDLRQPNEYEVSINLNPAQRGKGYAPQILRKSIEHLLTIRKVNKLWAGCKKINDASRKSFVRAGFVLTPNEAYEQIDHFYCEWHETPARA